MTECPDLELLRTHDVPASLAAHLVGCTACRLVVDLARERDLADAGRAACDRFEDLLAIRDVASIDSAAVAELDAHVASCTQCRAVASTMAPAETRHGALPIVATASYAIGREVARGGMGRILAAHDLRIGRPVAVKELIGAAPSLCARFEREARITARLQHPGIVPIYEIGAWPDGTPFYAMRMVEGRTLAVALRELDTLDARLVLLPSLIAASEAVAFAHANQIIHRDLTPSNVMVGAFGDTVVIDWGLAKDLSDETSADAPDAGPYRGDNPGAGGLTAVGAVVGTAAYMPPEQARGDTVDARADVYALGAILYHLLAGTAPYRAGTSFEVVERVKEGPPPALETLAPGAPADLLSIASKAMARDPDERYASARELADELVRFQTGRIVEAHRYSRGELARRWVRAHRGALIGVVAAVIALGVAGSVGIAGMVRERDRADVQRDDAVAQRVLADEHQVKEHEVAVALLEEQGRQELLGGDAGRALAYLDEALQQGLDTPALRLMLASALRNSASERLHYACDGGVFDVVSSAAGALVAAPCGDIVRVWNAGDARTRFSVPVAHAQAVEISHDGRLLVAVGDTAKLTDTATGAAIAQIGDTPSRFAFFAPDDRQVTVVHDHGHIQVWSVAPVQRLREFVVPTPAADDVSAAMSADGHVLAVATLSGHVEVWDVNSGVRLTSFEDGYQIRRVLVAADGKTLVTCGVNPTIRLRDPTTGRVQHVIAAHTAAVFACAMSPDSSRLLVASVDNTADEWDVRTGAKHAALAIPSPASSAAYSADGRTIATGHATGAVMLWAADTGVEVARYEGAPEWPHVAFSADGALVLATDGTQVTAWSALGRRRMSFVPDPDEFVIGTNLDATRVFTQRVTGELFVRDAVTGQQVGREAIHLGGLHHDEWNVSVSPDGRRYAASAAPGKVAIIDVQDGSTVASIDVAHDPTGMWLDQTGARLLVVGDGPARVWDVDHGRLVAALDHHTHAAGLDPSGRLVLAWTDPHSVDVWDVDATRARSTLHVGGEFVMTGFDATGTRILLSEQPGMYATGLSELFDVGAGTRLFALPGTADFDQTRTLITTYGSGRFEIWRAANATRLHAGQIAAPGARDADGAPGVSDDGRFLVTSGNSLSVDVRDAADGRVLDRLDGSSLRSFLLPRGGVHQPGVPPAWIPGTHSVIASSGRTSVWDLELEQRTPAEVHRLVAMRARWRVVDGKLVPALGRIEGRVMHAGAPAGGARVFAKLAPYNVPYETITTDDGTYVLDSLPFGAYAVSVGAGAVAVTANVTSREPVRVDITR